MLGKLTWNAIPWDQPIPLVAGAGTMLILLAVVVWVVVKGHLPYLWHEWITSVDHKRIGVMYTLLGLVMLVRGFVDAIMIRSQQALAYQSPGYLPPEHYNQVFSAHGTIMIFFGAMPIVIGLMNFVVPLQLGVRDVAFPTLNSTSFWLTATGALLVNISLVVGEFARTGWLAYPPLSEIDREGGVPAQPRPVAPEQPLRVGPARARERRGRHAGRSPVAPGSGHARQRRREDHRAHQARHVRSGA